MRQDEISPPPASRKKRKRVGRGDGSGHGTYSGRGCKGQKSRSGFKMSRGFEGGQLSLIKRLPRKRGFTNISKMKYNVINVGELNVFEAGIEVTPEKLVVAGLIRSLNCPIKILADGNIDNPLIVRANKFSAAAKVKIEAAGGKVEEVIYASKTD